MKNLRIDLFHSTLALLTVVVAVSLLCSAAMADSEATGTIFYDYSADKVSFDRKTGVAVWEGDAKLKVRNSDDYMNADKITIYRDVETGELIRVEAAGNVDMNEKGMKATCEHAILYEKDGRIELEGTEDSPAVAVDGENRMEGPAITYLRKEDRLEARGNGKGRITGHIAIGAKETEAADGETKKEGEE